MKELETIKQIIDDNNLEINGRVYNLTPTTHERRLKVFAFFTSIQNQLQTGDFSFLVDNRYKEVEKIITDMVLFENGILTKEVNHFEKYPEDFILFITTMLMVVSYPFLKGRVTN